jgi:mannose-6-phosphate isomerase-like protein (cupin superfamily)
MGCRVVNKGWGEEIIFADHPEYAGKLLVFKKQNAQFSMHFHKFKKETWYVIKGIFRLDYIDTQNAEKLTVTLNEGDAIDILPCTPHRLTCFSENGILIEVSMPDSVEDNFRVAPGDSQIA